MIFSKIPSIVKRNNGQALIEAVIIIPAFLILAFSILGISYQTLVYYYSEHFLHQTLICLDHSQVNQCRSKLGNTLKRVLIFNEQTEITIKRNQSYAIGSLLVRFNVPIFLPILRELELSQTINLPIANTLY